MEVVRDRADNCIIVCSIENVDPMGVHTGDSITVAPALTLTDKEYQSMRNASIAVLREIGVETGGSNVQFAVNPEDGRLVVIEMNPRVSRSSALASKATGFPDRQGRGQARGRLHARRDRERHHRRRHAGLVRADDRLCRHQDPALRLREVPGRRAAADHRDEVGRRGDGDRPHLRREPAEGAARAGDRAVGPRRDRRRRGSAAATTRTSMRAALASADARPAADGRAGAARRASTVERDPGVCGYDPWFLAQHPGDRRHRRRALRARRPAGRRRARCAALKAMGFSDARLGQAHRARARSEVRKRARWASGVRPVFKRIDTCAAEFEAPHRLHVLDLRGAACRRRRRMREPAHRPAQGHHPRRRAQPDRAGDRVRLLLLPRLLSR